MSAPHDTDADFLIIGGGFYGCCLALFLRSLSEKVILVEAGEGLLERASRVNQARIHTGFHYPRSFLTALKSMTLHETFAADFPDAIVDDFQMLYAVARQRSKVSAGRFYKMFRNMGAPIEPARPHEAALFDDTMIEASFRCREFAFNYARLRALLDERLDRLNVIRRYGARVEHLDDGPERARVVLADGSALTASHVFNVTYSQINQVLRAAALEPAPLKHEFAELALVAPPSALDGLAVTVMDGPFFSLMPYPAEGLYSLTHVRYTPHFSWVDGNMSEDAYAIARRLETQTRARHMMLDAARYMPCVAECRYEKSVFDVKTVLLKNERDDGRPILFQRRPAASRVISIMGGKIDNIYDLFDLIRTTEPAWARAHDRHVLGAAA